VRKRPPRTDGWWRAAAYAVALHLLVVALLVVGFRFNRSRPLHLPMQASVIREPAPEAQEQDKKRQEQEQRSREAAQKQVVEDAQRQKQELAEKKRQQEAETKKKEEAQRKKEKEEAEHKKQLTEAEKHKREDEHKKELEREQQRRQAQDEFKRQVAKEDQSRLAARDKRLLSDREKYMAMIEQKIKRNWAVPPASRKGLRCVIHVVQVPGGEVMEAKVVQPSGDPVYDHSLEVAAKKASPLPMPDNPEVFDRDLDVVCPHNE